MDSSDSEGSQDLRALLDADNDSSSLSSSDDSSFSTTDSAPKKEDVTNTSIDGESLSGNELASTSVPPVPQPPSSPLDESSGVPPSKTPVSSSSPVISPMDPKALASVFQSAEQSTRIQSNKAASPFCLASPADSSSVSVQETVTFFRKRKFETFFSDDDDEKSSVDGSSVKHASAGVDEAASPPQDTKVDESVMPKADDQKDVPSPSPGVPIDEPAKTDDDCLEPSIYQERTPEIDPALYSPPEIQHLPTPLVHEFNEASQPAAERRALPVQQVFPDCRLWEGKFTTFNHMQSQVANTLAYSDDNLVVSAPTGAGKTVIFEMAMARFFQVDLKLYAPLHQRNPQVSKRRKIVYISPSKALCEERFNDWSIRLNKLNLGIQVSLITGDGDPGEAFADLSAAHVILTTPEKWDSLTRRWAENFFLFATVKLVLIDEVHMIATDSRGPTLESIVCRLKSMKRAARQVTVTQEDIQKSSFAQTVPDAITSEMRILGVSATLPNIDDIAAFLGANEAYVFDSSYRPVPLSTYVVGVGHCGDQSRSQYQFWKGIDREVPQIIHRFSDKRPCIIFCHSKADTEKLADMLATTHGIGSRGGENADIAGQTRLPKLQRCLMAGTAFHHAGLELDNRRLVERAFSNGRIRVLCATSTLAVGVNLPAHLVIIKGTKAWRGAEGFQDLDQASLLQMIGRAGRPGLDTSGKAVIMTDNKSKPKFDRLVLSGLEVAKSKLPSGLEEILNTEVSQRVVTSVESAVRWMKGTLFFFQLTKNPEDFGLRVVSEYSVESHLFTLCTRCIRHLEAIDAVATDDTEQVHPLSASHIMSQNLVDLQAMQLMVQLPFNANQHQLLKCISGIEGIHRPVRRSEKKSLNEMQKMVRYKLDGPASKARVKEPSDKVFVLLQAWIEGLQVTDYALKQEMSSMVDYATRMLSAMEEYSAKGSKHGGLVLQAARLRRSLLTKLWSGHDRVLSQFPIVSTEAIVGLKFNGISSFHDVSNSTEEAIEKATKRSAPFGTNLKKAVAALLNGRLELSGSFEYAIGGSTPSTILCTLNQPSGLDDPGCSAGIGNKAISRPQFSLLVFTDQAGSCLAYEHKISQPCKFRIDCPAAFATVSIHLISSIVGLDVSINLKGSLFSETPPRPTKNVKVSTKTTGQAAVPVRKSNPRFRSSIKPFLQKTQVSNRSQKKLSQKVTPSPQENANKKIRSLPYSSLQPEGHFSEQRGINATPGPENRQDNPSIHTGHPTQAVVSTMDNFRRNWPQGTNDAPSELGGHRGFEGSRLLSQGSYMQLQERAPAESYIPAAPVNGSFENRWTTGVTTLPEEPRLRGRRQVTQSNTSGQTRSSWQHAKKQQHRSQRRAFLKKNENPFSVYQHDPNNAEANLDNLSGQGQASSSIIPEKALRDVMSYYNGERANYTVYGGQPIQIKPRRQRRTFTMDNRTLLAAKADEQNALLSSSINAHQNSNTSNGQQWGSANQVEPQPHIQDPRVVQYVPEASQLGHDIYSRGMRSDTVDHSHPFESFQEDYSPVQAQAGPYGGSSHNQLEEGFVAPQPPQFSSSKKRAVVNGSLSGVAWFDPNTMDAGFF